MKKILYRCCSMLFAVAMILSVTSAAFAFGVEPLGAGSGYIQGSLRYNGKSYDYNFWIEASKASGYRAGFLSDAACTRTFSDLEVEFETKNYGYVSAYGGGCTCLADENNLTSYSNWVACPRGNSQIVSFPRATCTVSLTGTTPSSITVVW